MKTIPSRPSFKKALMKAPEKPSMKASMKKAASKKASPGPLSKTRTVPRTAPGAAQRAVPLPACVRPASFGTAASAGKTPLASVGKAPEVTTVTRAGAGASLCREPQRAAFLSRRLALKTLLASLVATAASSVVFPATLPAAGRPRVLAATYPAWLALRTATEGLSDFECELLVDSLAGCPHDHAMTPRERVLLSSCDILVLNGLGFEAFLDRELLSSLSCQVVDLADEIAKTPMLPREGEQWAASPLAPASGNGDEREEHRGHDHGGVNPHHFANPSRFALMVRVLARVLGKAVPGAATILETRARKAEERAQEHLASMRALERGVRERHPDQKVRLVLQHDTLAWFFADTDFVLEAVLQEGDDEAPSAARLVGLVERMKEEPGIWLLVGESNSPRGVLDVLAKETGKRAIVLDPMAAGPASPSPNFYFETMAENRRVLAEALSGALAEALPGQARAGQVLSGQVLSV